MECAELQRGLFAGYQEWCILAEKCSCKRVDQLMLRNSVFRVRNFEISSVLSSNEVDLMKLRNRVFMIRNAQKCAIFSSNETNLLMLRKGFFSLRNVQI